MPDTIIINLTKEQGEEISRFWANNGGWQKAMLGQPGIIKDGIYTKMKIRVMDEKQAEEIATIASRHNDPSSATADAGRELQTKTRTAVR